MKTWPLDDTQEANMVPVHHASAAAGWQKLRPKANAQTAKQFLMLVSSLLGRQFCVVTIKNRPLKTTHVLYVGVDGGSLPPLPPDVLVEV
jgi:hypothetical protein